MRFFPFGRASLRPSRRAFMVFAPQIFPNSAPLGGASVAIALYSFFFISLELPVARLILLLHCRELFFIAAFVRMEFERPLAKVGFQFVKIIYIVKVHHVFSLSRFTEIYSECFFVSEIIAKRKNRIIRYYGQRKSTGVL